MRVLCKKRFCFEISVSKNEFISFLLDFYSANLREMKMGKENVKFLMMEKFFLEKKKL